jgi:hypothetical protein
MVPVYRRINGCGKNARIQPALAVATIKPAMIQYLYLGRVDYDEGLRLFDLNLCALAGPASL